MEWSNWNEHKIAQCPPLLTSPPTLTVENVREVVASGEGGELVWCPTLKVAGDQSTKREKEVLRWVSRY